MSSPLFVNVMLERHFMARAPGRACVAERTPPRVFDYFKTRLNDVLYCSQDLNARARVNPTELLKSSSDGSFESYVSWSSITQLTSVHCPLIKS